MTLWDLSPLSLTLPTTDFSALRLSRSLIIILVINNYKQMITVTGGTLGKARKMIPD